MIDWAQISPRDFETLCGELLEANGLANIVWYGSAGSDKGRDLTATKVEEPLPGIRRERQWVVQCKRYVRHRPTKDDIEGALVAAKEHSPDTVLLIIANTLSSHVRDWLNAVSKDYSFEVLLWEARDLEREVAKHRHRLSQKPPIVPQAAEPIYFYVRDSGYRSYYCNELEDVGFEVMNAMGPEEDIPRIREFIEFIRHNEVVFDEGHDDSRDEQ